MMMNLPLLTHRELSQQHHVREIYMKKFLQMIKAIGKLENQSQGCYYQQLKPIQHLQQEYKSSIYEVDVSDIETLVFHQVEKERL